MSSSTLTKIISGAPQGSVLDPLLSLIYINDIFNINLSNNSQVVLYANDIVLYKVVKTDTDYETHIYCKIALYTKEHLLSFNPLKCKYMLLTRRSAHTQLQ